MELASKLRELGAAWDANSVRIDVDTHTGDRRLIAMRTFDVGEELARIESSGCLGPSTTTAAAADAAERMQRAAAKYCESSWVPTLAFVLMYERSLGQSSQWYGYVSSLPVQADVPSSFSSSQWPTAILRGTEAQALVSSDELRAGFEYNTAVMSVLTQLQHSEKDGTERDEQQLSLDAYRRARSVVLSRAFDVGGEDRVGLVPFIDLANHRTTTRRRRRRQLQNMSTFTGEHLIFKERFQDEEEDAEAIDADMTQNRQPSRFLTLVTSAPIEKGDEIFNSYGKLGNAKLLSQFGFTLHDNPYDRVALDASLVIGCAAVHGCRDARRRFQWCSGGRNAGTQDTMSTTDIDIDSDDDAERLLIQKVYLENGFEIGWLHAAEDVDASDNDDDMDGKEKWGVDVSRALLLLLLLLCMRAEDFERCCRLCPPSSSEKAPRTQESAIISTALPSFSGAVTPTYELITAETAPLLQLCLERRESAYFAAAICATGDSSSRPSSSLEDDVIELDALEKKQTLSSSSSSYDTATTADMRRLHCLRVRTAERQLLATTRVLAASKSDLCEISDTPACNDDGNAAWTLFQ